MCAHQRLLQPDDGKNQCRSSLHMLQYPIDEKHLYRFSKFHSSLLPPPEGQERQVSMHLLSPLPLQHL